MALYLDKDVLRVLVLKQASIFIMLTQGRSLSHVVHDLVKAVTFILLKFIIKNIACNLHFTL